MKSLIKNSALLIFASIVILLWYSCTQAKNECSTCRILPKDGEIRTKINNVEYKMPYWETTQGDSVSRYLTTKGEGTMSQIDGILSWLQLPKQSNSASIVLFVNMAPTSGEKIAIENVLGCQYYHVIGTRLMHEFYLMHNGKMLSVASLRGECNGISFNNREDLYTLYFKNLHNVVSAIAISDYDVHYRNDGINEISPAINYAMRHNHLAIASKAVGETGERPKPECKKPCADVKATRECKDNGHLPASCDETHGPTDDPSERFAEESYIRGYQTRQDADITFNLPLEYLFRDSLMKKTNLGRKYVDYYYNVTTGYYLTEDIILQTIIVLNMFNTKMNWLLNPSTYGNETLVDPLFASKVEILLDLMVQAAPNEIEKGYFLDVKNDLHQYTGYTVMAFLNNIN